MRRLPLPGNAAVSYDLRAIAPGSCPPVLEAGSRLSRWVGKAVGALAAQGPGGGPPLAINPSWSAAFQCRAAGWKAGGCAPPTWHRGGEGIWAAAPGEAPTLGPGSRPGVSTGGGGQLSIPPAPRGPARLPAVPGLPGSQRFVLTRDPSGQMAASRSPRPLTPGWWRGIAGGGRAAWIRTNEMLYFHTFYLQPHLRI